MAISRNVAAPDPSEAADLPPQHPDDQGHIVLLCLAGGPVYALAAYLLVFDRLSMGTFLPGVFWVALLGVIAGLICLPFAWMALRRRDCSACCPVVAWTVGAIVLAIAAPPYFDGGTAAVMVLFAAPLTLIVVAFVTAALSPRVYRVRNGCSGCGYDLRGSLAAGRCPECGANMRFDAAPPPQPRSPAGWWTRRARQIARHPIALTALLILLAFTHAIASDTPQWSADTFRVAAQRSLTDGVPLRFGDATDFDWEQAYIFTGYTSAGEIDNALGFQWRAVSRPDISTDDGQQIVAFVSGNRVVRYCVLRDATRTEGYEFTNASTFRPAEAFRVETDATSSKLLRLIRLRPPAASNTP